MKEKALPEGWVKSKLGDYLYLKNGYAFKKTKYSDKSENSYPIIRISDIDGSLASDKNSIHTLEKADGFELQKGDLLIAMSGATTGKMGVYQGNLPAYQNQRVGNLKLRGEGDEQFRNYLMLHLQKEIEILAYGNAQPNISGKMIEDLDVYLPPLPQQQKLAKKFTALLSQVAEIKQRLEKIPALLKTYRQSVLARAVNGELSAKWREENGVSLESWECGYIKDFVEKPIYGTSAKSQKEGKIPVLRMGNIQAGQIDWENLVYTSNDAEIQKYSLNKYDVLFNRTNSPELVGKTAIYLGEREAIFAGYLIRVRCKNMLNPKFLNYHLNSPFAKNYCLEVKSDGVSQSNINAQKLLAYPLNLPSLEEQNYITQAVEKHLNFANQLEAQVNAALERVNLMTQAILAKGFCGELL